MDSLLRLGKVVKIWPEAHKVDLTMTDSGQRFPMVDVMAMGHISTNSGSLDLHIPTPPATPYDIQNTGNRDVFAYVLFAGNLPVVIGFKVPEIGQMTFKDPGRRIDRHGSDVYSTLTDTGDYEMAWPNGTYVRVAATTAHEDLTGKDFDEKWKIARNTGAALHIHVEHAAGAFTLDVDPSGNITTKAPLWTHTGNIVVTGSITASGEVSATGTHLHTHMHTGVTTGAGNTGAPV